MASKKELEERIAALEVEVALLGAQVHHQPMKVLPRPSDVPWPRDWNPYWPPQVWCGSGISPALKNTYTFNAAAR